MLDDGKRLWSTSFPETNAVYLDLIAAGTREPTKSFPARHLAVGDRSDELVRGRTVDRDVVGRDAVDLNAVGLDAARVEGRLRVHVADRLAVIAC